MSSFDPLLRQLTIANQLTLLRLAAVPAFALALLAGHPVLAFGLFVGATITDRLDGIAARRLGQATSLGAFLDPAADKLLMVSAYLLLAMPDHPRPFPEFSLVHHMPAWVTILVVARDVMIVIVAAGLYFAHQITSFPPTRLGKWNTGTEMVVAALFLFSNAWDTVPHVLLQIAPWVAASLIVASGLQYLVRVSRRTGAMSEESAK